MAVSGKPARSASRAALDPDFFGGHLAEDGSPRRGLDRESLVVVLLQHLDPPPGSKAKLMQKDEQLRVALVKANDAIFVALGGLGKQDMSSLRALRGRFGQNSIAVRAKSLVAQPLNQFGFEGGRDSVLQMLRLAVDLVP